MNPLVTAFADFGTDATDCEKYLYTDDGASNYVIFFTGRCGSTLLTSLIRNSKLNGNPEEFLNEEYVKYWRSEHPSSGVQDFFQDIRGKGSLGGRFGFEIDPVRLSWLMAWEGMNESAIFRNTAGYIWLTRTDIVAQAFSYAIAKKSGIWHSFAAIPVEGKSDAESVTDVDVWGELLSIICAEDWMEKVFVQNSVQPLRVSYEELVTDRLATLSRVFSEINQGAYSEDLFSNVIGAADGLNRLKYSGKEKVYANFWIRNRSLLNEVLEMRVRKRDPETAIKLVTQAFNKVGNINVTRINFKGSNANENFEK